MSYFKLYRCMFLTNFITGMITFFALIIPGSIHNVPNFTFQNRPNYTDRCIEIANSAVKANWIFDYLFGFITGGGYIHHSPFFLGYYRDSYYFKSSTASLVLAIFVPVVHLAVFSYPIRKFNSRNLLKADVNRQNLDMLYCSWEFGTIPILEFLAIKNINFFFSNYFSRNAHSSTENPS